MYVYVWVCARYSVCTEIIQEDVRSVLSFHLHFVGSRDQTLIIRLGAQHLYLPGFQASL